MVKNMGSLVWLLFAVCSSLLFSSSLAYTFYVGGRDGWVSNPVESFNHWSERNRFQVNDTLTFKTKEGSEDSVLVVKKDDYYSCNTKNPIMNLQSDTKVFKFDHSGPFFFIDANKQNCLKGQKLIVIVMAVRHKTPPPKSSPVTPSPVANSPKSSPYPAANSPKSSSPSPSSSLSPSPAANSPKSSSPSHSPVASSPKSPSPAANSPKSSSPSPSPVASSPKSPSPTANSPKSSSPSPYWSLSPSPASSPKSPSPAANSPKTSSPSPAAEGPISPAISPGPSPSADSPAPTPESGETADLDAPAPANSKSGSQAVKASTSMMLIMAIGVVILSGVYGL